MLLIITGCNNNNDINSIIEDKNTIIIDVRTEEEYNERHIDRAINIPVDNIQNIKNRNKLPKYRKYEISPKCVCNAIYGNKWI